MYKDGVWMFAAKCEMVNRFHHPGFGGKSSCYGYDRFSLEKVKSDVIYTALHREYKSPLNK